VQEKSALRRRMAAIRDAIPADERNVKSEAIARQLADWEWFRQARTILAFLSTRSEVLTAPIVAVALAAGKAVGAPRTLLAERHLDFRLVRGEQDELALGPFGILEPTADLPPIDPAAADMVLVPGLAFDARGYRLGYGGGFYDRLLAGPAANAAAVGLAFEEQVVERVSHTKRDLPVDWVVTERRIIDCAAGRRGRETR
jgi:5-formyltetrahydrofolate cyclo-ligase